jgi:hypothetical protein
MDGARLLHNSNFKLIIQPLMLEGYIVQAVNASETPLSVGERPQGFLTKILEITHSYRFISIGA